MNLLLLLYMLDVSIIILSLRKLIKQYLLIIIIKHKYILG